MVRRQIAAWFVSSTSVVIAGGVAVSTVSVAELPAAPSGPAPTVTVYEDRYVDDIRWVAPVGTPTAAPGELADVAPGASTAGGLPEWVPVVPRGRVNAATPSPTPTPARPEAPAAPAGSTPAPAPAPPPAPRPTSAPSTSTTSPRTTAPRTTAPATTVPRPTSPTTTWPPGTELPSDWPVGKPYPPLPPNCRKPHLEDDGVWNCEH